LLRLSVLLAVLLAEPPPSSQDPGQVRDLADEILSRDEFQPPSETLLERLARWISDLFDFGEPRVGSASSGSGGSAVVTLLLLAAALVGIVVLLRVVVRRPRRRRPPPEPEPDPDVEVARTVDEWTAAALRHEAAGAWKDGLRCRFRALVTRLIERGLVPEVAGRTSGELRTDVRATVPAAGEDFDEAADLFDRAWYGDLPTGPDEASRFAAHAERVLAAEPAVASEPAVAREPAVASGSAP
jgi:hypothetical protein